MKADSRRQKAEGRGKKDEGKDLGAAYAPSPRYSGERAGVRGRALRARRGLSYLEVLIASGIALTGILALLALFPVAILNLQKGQITDVMAAIGPSALRSGEAAGVTKFSNWLAYNGGTWTASGFLQTQPLPANLPSQPGGWHSLCFDPRFCAEGSPATANAAFAPGVFPYTPPVNVNDVRMVRVTLRGAPGTTNLIPMTTVQSRTLFKVQDDVLFVRPPDETSPAQQLPIEADGSPPTVVRRNYMADYEYVITMTPNLRGIPVGYDPANPGLNPISYTLGGGLIPNEPMPMDFPSEYTMSAVVFHKRQVDLGTHIPGDNREPEAERVADVIQFHNSGFNGGDITIQTRSNAFGNELEVHQGDWVLLSGNMYTQGAQRKFMGPLFQWYRVASVNGDSYPPGTHLFRDLTLDGPDWPVGLMAPLGSPGGVQLTIVSGVVGVFNTQVQVR